jgi:hypothetical protein
MKNVSVLVIAAFAGLSAAAPASAQSAGNLIGAPLVGAGVAVSGVAGAHHAGPAQVVNGVSPTLAPVTDGVTRAIGSVGDGVAGTGQSVQANGVVVGTQAGQQPLASVGATNPAGQGSVVSVLGGHP